MRKNSVYWWEDAPLSQTEHKPVAPESDVVVVGAGYTGLSAAITLARAGRSVQVFDKQRPGEGASTRNGGITSGNLRPSRDNLIKRFGKDRAIAIHAESKAARDDLYRFIADEGVACDFVLTGRFTGAAAPSDYERLAREADMLNGALGIEAHAISRQEQHSVLGTELYHGGLLRMDIGGLQPAKLHAEMLRIAIAAGVKIHGETAVLGWDRSTDGFEVSTARGAVRARHIMSAVNGYTDRSDQWLRRRLVPVRSRMIATEPLSPNLIGELMPRRVMCGDTRELSYYYRPSPDGRRILLGGRDGTISGDPDWPTDNLRRALIEIFPVLESAAITNTWFGHVAMNRDMIPRIFSQKGVRYAAGYCGSGVVWARWAGQKAALQILGESSGQSSLDFHPPAAVPLFSGKPWFMPAVFGWFRFKDRIARRRRARGR